MGFMPGMGFVISVFVVDGSGGDFSGVVVVIVVVIVVVVKSKLGQSKACCTTLYVSHCLKSKNVRNITAGQFYSHWIIVEVNTKQK